METNQSAMSTAQHTPAWLDHATQVSIAASIPGVYSDQAEALRISARWTATSGAPANVHHFTPDNWATISAGKDEAQNCQRVQAQIDSSIAKSTRVAA